MRPAQRAPGGGLFFVVFPLLHPVMKPGKEAALAAGVKP